MPASAVLMVVIDSGILNLIVPSIQKDFNASESTIGLMASISTLMLAAFTLGGTLGDDLLKRVLSSDVPSIASQFAIAPEKLEGLVGNYQAAFTTGVTQMMLVLAIALLLAAVLVWFGLRSERMAR